MLIVGHRGSRHVAPENTEAAFRLALAVGVDAVELDVHLSRDGELIVMHDATLDRTTDGAGPIRARSLTELKKLNAAAKHEPAGASQRIPTLQEVFDLVRGRAHVNVEVKTDSEGTRYPDIERKVVDLVRKNRAEATAVISSFDFPTLASVRAMSSAVRTHAIISKGYFQVLGGLEPGRVADDLSGRGFTCVAVNTAYLSEALTRRLLSAGIAVHAWVVNEVAELWTLMKMGVQAVATDRPDVLVPIYKSAGGRPL
jgi:glycerophosphoryl diester phosphodiesterase